jgi:hypothetical protein
MDEEEAEKLAIVREVANRVGRRQALYYAVEKVLDEAGLISVNGNASLVWGVVNAVDDVIERDKVV